MFCIEVERKTPPGSFPGGASGVPGAIRTRGLSLRSCNVIIPGGFEVCCKALKNKERQQNRITWFQTVSHEVAHIVAQYVAE